MTMSFNLVILALICIFQTLNAIVWSGTPTQTGNYYSFGANYYNAGNATYFVSQ